MYVCGVYMYVFVCTRLWCVFVVYVVCMSVSGVCVCGVCMCVVCVYVYVWCVCVWCVCGVYVCDVCEGECRCVDFMCMCVVM